MTTTVNKGKINLKTKQFAFVLNMKMYIRLMIHKDAAKLMAKHSKKIKKIKIKINKNK